MNKVTNRVTNQTINGDSFVGNKITNTNNVRNHGTYNSSRNEPPSVFSVKNILAAVFSSIIAAIIFSYFSSGMQ